MYVFACTSVHRVHAYRPWRQEEGVRYSLWNLRGGCEQLESEVLGIRFGSSEGAANAARAEPSLPSPPVYGFVPALMKAMSRSRMNMSATAPDTYLITNSHLLSATGPRHWGKKHKQWWPCLFCRVPWRQNSSKDVSFLLLILCLP